MSSFETKNIWEGKMVQKNEKLTINISLRASETNGKGNTENNYNNNAESFQ